VWLIANALRPRFAQRLPFAFGWLSKSPLDRALADAFMRPALTDRRIRRELAAILRAIDKRYTLEAAQRFVQFDKPVLLAGRPRIGSSSSATPSGWQRPSHAPDWSRSRTATRWCRSTNRNARAS
jgi:hypothetical protein